MKIRGLDWDDDDDPAGNVQHIRLHGVTPSEVAEVLEGAPSFFVVEPRSEGRNPYYVAVGYTAEGRLLEVWGVLYLSPPMENYWHTATAMDARPRWGREYQRMKGMRE